MTLDLLDRAFMRRLDLPPPPATAASRAGPASSASPAPGPAAAPVPAPAPVPKPAPPVATAAAHASPGPCRFREVAAASPSGLVGRLLEQAVPAWESLATHVEAARRRGRRVIAVAGCQPREGRTTLLACLAAALGGRGHTVVSIDAHDVAAVASNGPVHDKRIILVDAGVWFPPGPIRRQLLLVASLGCEAAILVRRSGTGGSVARAAALEAIGIEVLGEVLTFAPVSGTGAAAADAVGGRQP